MGWFINRPSGRTGGAIPAYVGIPTPTAPVLSIAGYDSTSVDLSWTAATDVGGPGIGGYLIYRDGGQIQSVSAGTFSYHDPGRSPGTLYTYNVRAFDLNNLQGPLSNSAPVTTLSLPGTGFFDDPYAGYPTKLVDPVNGQDIPGGVGLVQTWNGVTAPWLCYKTLAYAIADYFVFAGVRIGLLQNTTHTVSATLTYPVVTIGTLGPTSMRVLQADPAATQATMPRLTWPTSPDRSAIIAPGGVTATVGNDATYSVLRKLEIAYVSGSCVFMNAFTSYSIIEFCHIHDAHLVAADNVAAVYFSGNSHNTVVRYCKLHDITESNGVNDGAAIESYWAHDITVQFNDMYHCCAGVELKGAPSQTSNYTGPAANGWTIRNNLIHDQLHAGSAGGGGLWFIMQSAFDPAWQGTVFSNNLVYNLFDGISCGQAPSSKYAQGTTLTVTNNTIAQDVGSGFATTNNDAVVFKNNLIANAANATIRTVAWTQPLWAAGSTYLLNQCVRGSDNLFYQSLAAGNTGNDPTTSPAWWTPVSQRHSTFTTCDYNFYWHADYSDQVYGTAGIGYGAMVRETTFANWQQFHTLHPTYPLCANGNPDANGGFVASFVNGPADINFVDPSVRNYALKPTSPLKGAGEGGIDPGYDPTNCGPGW